MPSDLTKLKRGWKNLADEEFLALAPPTRSRYTQDDGHSDAAEEVAASGRPSDTPYAFWHWQSQERAISKGEAVGPLAVHWGGDRTVVERHLARLDGWQLREGTSETEAFVLDKLGQTDADGLPDPSNAAAVRRLMGRLAEPVNHEWPDRFEPLTPAQERWLHARLTDAGDLAGGHEFVVALERHQALTADEADRLYRSWNGDPEQEGIRQTVGAMLRTAHPHASEALDRLGEHALWVLAGSTPTQEALERLLGLARGGGGRLVANHRPARARRPGPDGDGEDHRPARRPEPQ